MDKNKLALSSLAMDLKRVSLSYYRNSLKTARIFSREALERQKDINIKYLKPYLRKIFDSLSTTLSQGDHLRLAEDALMYSSLFQNAALES